MAPSQVGTTVLLFNQILIKVLFLIPSAGARRIASTTCEERCAQPYLSRERERERERERLYLRSSTWVNICAVTGGFPVLLLVGFHDCFAQMFS